MSNAIASKGVSLANIFDPYVAGTTKARATSIGDASNDTSNLYANIIYGSAAAATGIKSENADLNTLYAAKGTANYALPINGNTYGHVHSVGSGTGWSQIGFQIVTVNTYQVYGTDSASSPTILATGSVPASATKVQFTWGTYTVPGGDTDAGGSTNNLAATPTALSSNPSANYTTGTFGSSSGTKNRTYTFTIDFFNAAGTNISHTVIYLSATIEGSAG